VRRAPRFWIGGDVHLGSERRGANDPIGGVLPPLIPILADSGSGPTPSIPPGIINLEGPIAEMGDDRPAPGLPANAAAALVVLTRAGVALVGVANNHAYDRGDAGLLATCQALRAAGLQPIGGPAGWGRLLVGQWTIGVAAIDLSMSPSPSIAHPVLVEYVRRAHLGCDFLVVTFHETASAGYRPTPALRAAVDAALVAGADVVAAHGRHTPGPVERRGDAVIAWGLGNLAFQCDCTQESDGLILEITIIAADSLAAAVIPVDAGLEGRPARPARDPEGHFRLLEAIGSPTLGRCSHRGTF